MIGGPEIHVSATFNTKVKELGTGIRHLTLVMHDAAGNAGADAILVVVHTSSGPEVVLTRSVAVPSPEDSVLINTTITDVSGVASALLSYTVGIGADRTNATMGIAESQWTTMIPRWPLGFSVQYIVGVTDMPLQLFL